MLTDNEKAAIIKAHIKNIASNKYNAELSLIEENLLQEPNQDVLSSSQNRISIYDAQISALESELSKLNITQEIVIPEANVSIPPIQQ